MAIDITRLLAVRRAKYDLHEKYLNAQLARAQNDRL